MCAWNGEVNTSDFAFLDVRRVFSGVWVQLHKMPCKCDSNDTSVRKSIDTLVHANYTDSQLVTHLLKQNGQL